MTGGHDCSAGSGGCMSSRAPWAVQMGKGQRLHPKRTLLSLSVLIVHQELPPGLPGHAHHAAKWVSVSKAV